MPTPTFDNLDVGLPGSASYPNSAQSSATVVDGDRVVATTDFAFSGVHGKFRHHHGRRGRTVTWRLVLRTSSLAKLNVIIASAENAKEAGSGQLATATGRVYQRAVVREVRKTGSYDQIKSGPLAGWFRQEVEIVFDVLSGD